MSSIDSASWSCGRSGASIAELKTVFVELASYARHHFAEEEALMAAMGLDQRHVERHRQDYASFIDEVTQLHVSVPSELELELARTRKELAEVKLERDLQKSVRRISRRSLGEIRSD